MGQASCGIDILLIDPMGDINRARDKEDWFSGFALSVSYFEYFGANAIRAYLKFHHIGTDETTGELEDKHEKSLKRLNVRTIVDFLFWIGLIGGERHGQMAKIIAERNSLVHHRKGAGYKFGDAQHFRDLLDNALTCIDVLQKIRPDQPM